MKTKKYYGKTLLVLGSNVSSEDIITYAKSNGAHTIVADYLPVEKSPAKKIADEHYLISTADLDQLGKLIEEKNVTSVLAGISEFNLINAMKLCDIYNLSFYCSHDQWNRIERKDLFRELCTNYQVPAPKTYYCGEKIPTDILDQIVYPAVLKPVDASTSAGVYICMNKTDVQEHENDSLNESAANRIILEEFIDGNEFTAHYVICNGKAKLACMDNRYPVSVNEGNVTTVPVARIYPCLSLDDYIEQVDPYMISMCEGLGLNNGILFVQGLHNPSTNEFRVFEAGLRCAGEAPYRFIQAINGVNFMQLLTDQCLLQTSLYDLSKEDPYLNGKCCGIVSFVTTGGIVGAVNGLEKAVKSVPSVVEYEQRYNIGDTAPAGNTLRQLMIRFVMVSNNRTQLMADVTQLNETIEVLDNKGNNMVLKLDPSRLLHEF